MPSMIHAGFNTVKLKHMPCTSFAGFSMIKSFTHTHSDWYAKVALFESPHSSRCINHKGFPFIIIIPIINNASATSLVILK